MCDLRGCPVGVADRAGGLVGAVRDADAIDFFKRPELAPAGPFDRIFHLAITAENSTHELAINHPFETPGLARLITLTRRAVCDRQVLSPGTLDDVQFAALAAAWLNARAGYSDDDPSR